ncbi:MAG: LysR family transcriptional regulator, partial [Treponema sp.]|jgi:DNA-binding transcriptional LysR family regulator|nr:LysR family transcriptional regulator [Treponema sp.]
MPVFHFRCFVRIAENGSYSATARECNISQSSVSKQIRTFEWELGCTLFDRSCHHVRLTEIGTKVYPLLKNMLAQFDAILQETHGHLVENAIKLVSLPIMGQYGVTEALRLFEAARKKTRIYTIEQEERDILDTLSNEDYDIAIIREEILPVGAYKKHRLAMDRLALIVHENHPYAANSYVTFDMLGGEYFMFMPRHTYIYRLCNQLCRKHGINPNVISCARIETILSNIESSRCSSMLMEKSVNMFNSSKVKAIPIEPPYTSNIVAVCPENGEQKKVVRDFINFIIHYFKAEAK